MLPIDRIRAVEKGCYFLTKSTRSTSPDFSETTIWDLLH